MTNKDSINELLNPQEAEDFKGFDTEKNNSQVSEHKGQTEQTAQEENKDSTVHKLTPEDMKLGGHKPLITLFRLIIGPILSQGTNALYGIITTIWISKAIGDDGLSAVSMMQAFDNIGRSFGFFLAMAAATQISFLYGKGKSEEAGQIIADLIRTSFICGGLVCAILLPILKPITKWFGASDAIVRLGFEYMLPLTACAFNSCLFIASGGFLQGEGRTFLFGMSNVVCLVLNMAVFNPIFLFWFKVGIIGASSATVISEFIPGIIIITLFYCHKFGVKPRLIQFCNKFSPNTLPALKVGFSTLIAQLSMSIPSVLIRKYMGLACDNDQQKFADVMAGFNASSRICYLPYSVVCALSQAYIPAASYSYAAKRYKRYLKLTLYMCLMMFIWSVLTCIMTWVIPVPLSKMFSSGEGYMKYASKMIMYNNALGFLAWFRLASQSVLQSLQMGSRATILSFISNFVGIIIFNYILYYSNPHDPVRMIWTYPLTHASSSIVCVCFLWKPIKNLIKLSKEDDEEEKYIQLFEMELEEVNDTNTDSSKLDNFVDKKDEKEAEAKQNESVPEIKEELLSNQDHE
ncbi:hypothetical protein M9Y10_036517 [Tritrichomonas musculus]|uniref:MatE family protein n=1 Tax=Tritrichomonas musculus TaxID=1915356 RepID=A0ABR2GU99_9EUKA